MPKVEFKLVFGCLNCDKPIPLSEARKGKQLCSMKCLREINKEAPKGFGFQKWEVANAK